MRFAHLVLVSLNVLHELFEVIGREIFPGDEHERHFGGLTDRGEVPTWIIFEIGILARCGIMRSEGADDQRVAICRGLSYAPAGDGSASTGVVFDNNRLGKRL